ncbi:unnamed protein product [Pleuronectes platessa]|uniref:Uncharacterized protein n=1 Tax=Pleuronectes platessa TaxID=8262 RepID=A0A9N7Y6J1_PLEPL|nr:unnamed protein product [Pleuronectes platessa]
MERVSPREDNNTIRTAEEDTLKFFFIGRRVHRGHVQCRIDWQLRSQSYTEDNYRLSLRSLLSPCPREWKHGAERDATDDWEGAQLQSSRFSSSSFLECRNISREVVRIPPDAENNAGGGQGFDLLPVCTETKGPFRNGGGAVVGGTNEHEETFMPPCCAPGVVKRMQNITTEQLGNCCEDEIWLSLSGVGQLRQ